MNYSPKLTGTKNYAFYKKIWKYTESVIYKKSFFGEL